MIAKFDFGSLVATALTASAIRKPLATSMSYCCCAKEVRLGM